VDDFTLLRRIEALEAQVLLLSQHLGVACPPFASTGFATPPNPLAASTAAPVGGPPPHLSPQQQAIVDLARSGNKLEAIKQYRALTGADLAEAKRFIESL